MRELLLNIDGTHGRRAGLERAIRDAVRQGRLPADTRMPSTRNLAKEMGLARATVVAAYEQLIAEGYLVAQQGASTRVASRAVPERPQAAATPLVAPAPAADFRPGEPDASLFPRSGWARSVRRVLSEAPDRTFGYADPLGIRQLRETIAQYIGRSRAVATDPDGVSMFGGVTASFGFLGEAFRSLGIDRIAIEDPSLFLLRDVWSIVGLTVVPVPVDGDGLCVAALDSLDVGAVVVTPSHQFPTGATMSPSRRSELIEWAQSKEAWIVEDDYDGEFRYDRRPIGALQGLDPDRVIYAGTVSKTLSPGLRMSWLVVPPTLRPALATVKHLRGGVSTIEQLALADFMNRGEMDRHLRQARSTYLDRQNALTSVLAQHASWLACSPSQAGLHLSATITDASIVEAELVARAGANDVGMLGFGPLWTGTPTVQGIVLGYSRPPAHRFPAALERLDAFLQSVS